MYTHNFFYIVLLDHYTKKGKSIVEHDWYISINIC